MLNFFYNIVFKMFDVSTQQTKKRMNKKEFRKATFADFFEVKSKLPRQNYEAEVVCKNMKIKNYKLKEKKESSKTVSGNGANSGNFHSIEEFQELLNFNIFLFWRMKN